MKVLVIDNYDSFTYNIVHILKNNACNVEVYRNDKIEISAIDKFDKIILSPGPGIPKQAGILLKLIETYAASKPIFGICLGLQAIVENFGGKLKNLKEVFHGVSTESVIVKQHYLFNGLPNKFEVGRYHSWVADKNNFPKNLDILSNSVDNQIMAVAHKKFDVCAVQFHPESILTKFGAQIVKNFIDN